MRKKTIVITGCSSGFGRCTALELARHSWHVFATVRKEEDRANLLQEAEQQNCQEHMTVLLCDITQAEQLAQLASEVETFLREKAGNTSELPHLDALLNNAGTAYAGPVELVALEDLRAQLEINVVAHVGVIQKLLPMLRAAHGTIINVSSISGKLVTPVVGPYAASKFALEAISDALRIELAPFGVRVVVIQPASSPTSIWKTSLERSLKQLNGKMDGHVYERLLRAAMKYAEDSSTQGFSPQRFADLVVKILASRRPRTRYGIPANATLIMMARHILPDPLWDRLIRSTMRW